MSISTTAADARAADVRVTSTTLTVVLRDGRRISAPLECFPRLKSASPKARAAWKPSAAGNGIHWPQIDEDLSVDGLLRGTRSPAPK